MPLATVLVVDDDANIIAIVRDALSDEGYEVQEAVDGQALAVAQRTQPDLILLDIMMPSMDGIEVSRRLRADPATAPIPIVAMSAVDTLHRAAGMPVDDHLPKPFDLDDLYAVVDRWTTPSAPEVAPPD